MRKRTTTQKINTAITNKLLNITKTELYNKTTHQTKMISADTFKESLDFLCETLFIDTIGWHYERNHGTGDYVIETGRMNGDSDLIIIAHLCVNDGVDKEDTDRTLIVIED